MGISLRQADLSVLSPEQTTGLMGPREPISLSESSPWSRPQTSPDLFPMGTGWEGVEEVSGTESPPKTGRAKERQVASLDGFNSKCGPSDREVTRRTIY